MPRANLDPALLAAFKAHHACMPNAEASDKGWGDFWAHWIRQEAKRARKAWTAPMSGRGLTGMARPLVIRLLLEGL